MLLRHVVFCDAGTNGGLRLHQARPLDIHALRLADKNLSPSPDIRRQAILCYPVFVSVFFYLGKS